MAASTFSPSRPAFCGEGETLGDRLHEAGDADLIHHLRELAGARRAKVDHGLRVAPQHGLGLGEVLGVAADHERELAVLGAGLAAGHRRVEEADAALLGGRVELARDRGRGGGVIHKHRAGLHAGERAVRSERHGFHVLVVPHAHHHEARALGGFARRGRGLATVLFSPLLGLGGGAVEHGDDVALGREVPGHGEAHHAKAKERDGEGRRGFGHGKETWALRRKGGKAISHFLASSSRSAHCVPGFYRGSARSDPGDARA